MKSEALGFHPDLDLYKLCKARELPLATLGFLSCSVGLEVKSVIHCVHLDAPLLPRFHFLPTLESKCLDLLCLERP